MPEIVRGPNARNDFHIDPGDEIFYQLKGDITVRCIDADGRPLPPGEIGWVGVNRRVIDNRKPFLFGKGGTMKHRV